MSNIKDQEVSVPGSPISISAAPSNLPSNLHTPIISAPPSNLPSTLHTPIISAPPSNLPSTLHTPIISPRPTSNMPSNFHSPIPRSPLPRSSLGPSRGTRTPRTPRTPRFLTPIASPMRKAVISMRGYLEDVGHLTKLDPQDSWLPITESRSGNAFYAAFHTLCAGIGIQALVLPVAFTFLGWTMGILCLTVAFVWQLYTLWILTRLHEAVPGTRYSRYITLAQAAFGDKLGNVLAKVPIILLSAGTCTTIIVIGASSMKLFYQIVCGQECIRNPALTTIEWYLAFTCLATVLSQLPNLNSIAGVSLIGSITAVCYCTIIWVASISRGRPANVSYRPIELERQVDHVFGVLNALGIIAFAFRGHNLTLEIQVSAMSITFTLGILIFLQLFMKAKLDEFNFGVKGTMPSSLKHPSHVAMWKGVKIAYIFIAFCIFPIAIGGYWAYGNLIPPSGILAAFYAFHSADISQGILGLTSLLVVINCLSSFQIYAMPVFDDMEMMYTSKNNKRCPWWLRAGFRTFFGAVSFLIGIALPFLASLSGFVGGLTLPVTLAYPCFMWVLIKTPEKYSASWYINWTLGSLGMIMSFLFMAGALYGLVDTGIKLNFFKPE